MTQCGFNPSLDLHSLRCRFVVCPECADDEIFLTGCKRTQILFDGFPQLVGCVQPHEPLLCPHHTSAEFQIAAGFVESRYRELELLAHEHFHGTSTTEASLVPMVALQTAGSNWVGATDTHEPFVTLKALNHYAAPDPNYTENSSQPFQRLNISSPEHRRQNNEPAATSGLQSAGTQSAPGFGAPPPQQAVKAQPVLFSDCVFDRMEALGQRSVAKHPKRKAVSIESVSAVSVTNKEGKWKSTANRKLWAAAFVNARPDSSVFVSTTVSALSTTSFTAALGSRNYDLESYYEYGIYLKDTYPVRSPAPDIWLSLLLAAFGRLCAQIRYEFKVRP